MKRIIFFCGIYLLFINTGCKKYSEESNTSIQGTWELRMVSGSFQINYPTGNGRTLSFSGDRYEMRENGQITRSGQYEIISDNTASSSTCLNIPSNQYSQRIVYDNNTTATKVFFELSGNKLTTVSGCFALDAGSLSEYERQ